MRSLVPLALLATLVALAGGCRSPEAAREHERKAAEHLQAGRGEDAVRELEAAVAEDPGAVSAALSLAAIHERAGSYARAIEVLKACLEARPTMHLARMSLAGVYERLGELDKALREYALVGQGASHARAFLGMADIYERRGEMAASERAILAAIAAEPTQPAPRYRLARLYDARGLPPARGAWERYVAAAAGNPDERARLDEAQSRLRRLASVLARDEKAALLATLRKHLDAAPAGRRSEFTPAEASPIAADAGPEPLRRFYPGRIHVKLHVAGADPVRGTGTGATLYEGVAAAAVDVGQSQLFRLYYSNAAARIRSEVHLEAGEPTPFTVEERDGDLAPREGGPLDPNEAIELKAKERSVLVLPTDRTARGLGTLRAALEWASRQAGAPADEWKRATLLRVPTRSFVESADGGGSPVDLEGGLPVPPPPTAHAAVQAGGSGAAWIASLMGAEGALPAGFTPSENRYVTATARAQAYAVVALADAGERLGDARLLDASRLAHAWLARQPPTPATAAPAARAALRVKDARALEACLAVLIPLQRADGGFEGGGHATEEAALAFAEASATMPALRAAALRALEAAVRSPHDVAGSARSRLPPTPGEGPGREVGSAGYMAAATLGAQDRADARWQLAAGQLAPRPGTNAGAIQANIALSAVHALIPVPKARGPADTNPQALLTGAIAAALRLAIDERASYPFPDRGRVIGAFRDGPYEPRISLEETARLASALLAAAPRLPEPAGASR